MKYLLLVCFFFLSLLSCKDQENSDEPIGPQDIAPHQADFPNQELSLRDQKKLTDAIGVEADSMSLQALRLLMDNDTEKTKIFVLWDTYCEDCLSQLKAFDDLSANQHELIDVFLVNLNSIRHYKDINYYIRKNQITNPVIALNDYDDFTDIHYKWSGVKPAFIVFPRNSENSICFEQAYEPGELMAVLSPFTL